MKYKIGDVVLYNPPDKGLGRHGILRISSREVKRGKGDLIPHFYYSGRLIGLDREGEILMIDRKSSTGLFNTRGSNLSNLNTQEVDLSSLV